MLKIRTEQMVFLNAIAVERFIDGAAGHVEAFFPSWAATFDDEEALTDWVVEVIDDAGEYSIDTEKAIYQYLNVAATFGRDFHRESWAQKILLNSRLSPQHKASFLEGDVDHQLDIIQDEKKAQLNTVLDEFVKNYSESKVEDVFVQRHYFDLPFIDKSQAQEWILRVAKRGTGYGFKQSFLMDIYLEASMRFGEDFDQVSWAQEILAAQNSENDKSMGLLAAIQEDLATVMSKRTKV
ncbi:Uncharacterised protein [BD1-7 clade bacterium]|uniref:Uncharacterized protein n=1 Tax=BD1-7 clade bacterium TaxID=2029982 RepID=A0A5S9QU33_9GAMM|nr:Uncharacterised protein [BD1-7 clade bacterium]